MGMIINLTNKKIFISKAIIYLIRAQNFPKTNIFYTLPCVCVSGSKKC